MNKGDFSIVNKTKGKLTSLPFVNILKKIKDDILGEDYNLSIAFVEKKYSHEINKKYRKKDKPTNVLSFALTKTSGELILCPLVIREEVKIKKFDKKFPELVIFLVIHGMLHLKGMDHGGTMERREQLYCEKYDTKHFSRNRHRIRNHSSRGGRI